MFEFDQYTTDPDLVAALDRQTALRALHAAGNEGRGSGLKKLRTHTERLGVQPGAIQHALGETNNLQGRVVNLLQWAFGQSSSTTTA